MIGVGVMSMRTHLASKICPQRRPHMALDGDELMRSSSRQFAQTIEVVTSSECGLDMADVPAAVVGAVGALKSYVKPGGQGRGCV